MIGAPWHVCSVQYNTLTDINFFLFTFLMYFINFIHKPAYHVLVFFKSTFQREHDFMQKHFLMSFELLTFPYREIIQLGMHIILQTSKMNPFMYIKRIFNF